MFKPLNPILHSELRLAIVSLLIGNEKLEFNYIKEATKATAGNLSVQINKLKEVKFIEVHKSFKGNYPVTECSITTEGITAFHEYVEHLKTYILK